MSAHRRNVERAVANRKLVGAGVAGVAAVFAVAPFAHADPSGASGSAATASAGPHSSAAPGPAGQPAGKIAPKAALPTTSTAATPNYGTQKIRVGVQIKSGAWVPDGTTTGNSTVMIHETGPNAEAAATQNGTSCQTVPNTEDPGSSETFCSFPFPEFPSARTPNANSGFDYQAFPGDTVVFTQTSHSANVLNDPVSQTVGPCIVPEPTINVSRADALPPCPDSSDPTEVVFNDPGLPPVAVNDHATTKENTAVTITVFSNDTTNGAPSTIAVDSDPGHGTAKVITSTTPGAEGARAPSAAGDPVIRYTPAAGFTGKDSFTYTLTDANGSSTATVFVTVTGSGTLPTAVATTTTPAAPIANTGTHTESIVELGGLLLALGGAATVVGRRRYHARHAGPA